MRIILISIVVIFSISSGYSQIFINEICSANDSAITDIDGDAEDFIELYNSGTNPIDIGGWHLTDSTSTPSKWSFPADTIIQANSYLIVWASGKDKYLPSGHYHTNFSISAEGESVTLSRPDLQIVDSLPPIRLPRNVSYGRLRNDPFNWGYFTKVTAGAPNSLESFSSTIFETPIFSHTGGFYTDSIQVELNTPVLDSETIILYTTDGSEPSPLGKGTFAVNYKNTYPQEPGDPFGPMLESSQQTLEYTDPINITLGEDRENKIVSRSSTYDRDPSIYTPQSSVFKGTVVRARLYKYGAIAGPVITNSYFITPLGISRYGIPVVSIACPEDSLFGYVNGIYNSGKLFDDNRTRFPNWAGISVPNNYDQQGSSAERAVHLEFFHPQEGRVEALDAQIRLSGTGSRRLPQKSLKIYPMSAQEGNDQSINQELFPGLLGRGTGNSVSNFRRLILRAGGQDRAAKIRDPLSQELVSHLSLDQQAYQPAIHFVNGEYFGITNLTESVDHFTIAEHHGLLPQEVALLKNNAVLDEGSEQDRLDFIALREFIQNHDLSDPVNMNYVSEKIDIDNFLLHHVVQIYLANRDWPGNNIAYWRRSSPSTEFNSPPTHDGRWRWIFYDLDYCLLVSNDPTLAVATSSTGTGWPNPQWSTIILRKLLDNSNFRNRFIQAFADHMATTFKPSRFISVHQALKSIVDPYYVEHSLRWRNQGSSNTNYVNTFAQQRPANITQQLQNKFNISGLVPLTIDCSDHNSGIVRVNTIQLTPDTPGLTNPSDPYPWTAEYFSGIPITLVAEPKPGYKFVGWLELPDTVSPSIEVVLSGPTTYTALFDVAEPEPDAVLLHAWNFDTPNFSDPSQTIGGGALATVLGSESSLERSDPSQGFESPHLRLNFPIGSTLTYSLPTTGYKSIQLSYITRRSGQGAGIQSVFYTTNGTDWIPLSTYMVNDSDPQLKFYDLSSVSGVTNNSAFAVRFSFSQGEGGIAGNNRFDVLRISGVPDSLLNQPPVFTSLTQQLQIVAGSTATNLDLNSMFEDPDGDLMTFQASNTTPELITTNLEGAMLSLSAIQQGSSTIDISATDSIGQTTNGSIKLLVYPTALPLISSDYLFTEWDSQTAAGVFPPHMIFLQGDTNDTLIDTPMNRAYEIPMNDAANTVDAQFPYAATSRTRINGRGIGGISFINTGRGRDLGSALLSLDTSDCLQVSISWLAGTISPGPRNYGLRLQVRAKLDEPFEDLLIDGAPIEYIAQSTAGHQQQFGPVSLPPEWLAKGLIQLQWRYYMVSGESGSRAQISLDDIVVGTVQPRTYDTWRFSQFLNPDDRNSEAISGPSATVGGLPNVLRYALGVGIEDSLQDRLPSLPHYSSGPGLRFTISPFRQDLRYRVSRSTDLIDWSNIIFDSSEDTIPHLEPNGTIEVIDQSNPSKPKAFYRLEVELD